LIGGAIAGDEFHSCFVPCGFGLSNANDLARECVLGVFSAYAVDVLDAFDVLLDVLVVLLDVFDLLDVVDLFYEFDELDVFDLFYEFGDEFNLIKPYGGYVTTSKGVNYVATETMRTYVTVTLSQFPKEPWPPSISPLPLPSADAKAPSK
jgi:hypothetical protein